MKEKEKIDSNPLHHRRSFILYPYQSASGIFIYPKTNFDLFFKVKREVS